MNGWVNRTWKSHVTAGGPAGWNGGKSLIRLSRLKPNRALFADCPIVGNAATRFEPYCRSDFNATWTGGWFAVRPPWPVSNIGRLANNADADGTIKWHNKRVNVSFADTHVEGVETFDNALIDIPEAR